MRMNEMLCGDESRIADAAEMLVGEAKSCWCCSFWRGMSVGFLAGAALGATAMWLCIDYVI